MREIRNEKRMDEYCKKYKIQSHFTDFKKLKKKLVEYKKGEIIELYGGKPDTLFFLVSGMVRFTCTAYNFEEYFFFDAINSGLFGEVEYIMNIPLITQSEVLEDSECIVIPIKENKELLDNDLIFQKFLGYVLAQKYNNLRNMYMNVETTSLKQRLAQWLYDTRNSSETLPNLNVLAKYLRCSYRHMLREVKFFCEIGCLERLNQKGKYRVKDYSILEKYIGTYKSTQ